ncbi:hypothetical protein ACJMK2_018876 [Sinanodonta woodiana]|uniref:Protein kinase domain-containing protein n=1 Tax=Sinanodonta woodiana TaxID=1069815 RepID=A0ABD3UEQ0_SINWO
MNYEPAAKKRRMEPHISGDDQASDPPGPLAGGFGQKSLTFQASASASASGDFSSVFHQYVTLISQPEKQEETNATSEPYAIYKTGCEFEDTWVYKYPIPLSTYPNKPIRTGNVYYDGIIQDLEFLGYKPLQVISKGRSATLILSQDLHKRNVYHECECVPVIMKLNSGKSKRNTRTSWRTDMLEELNIHSILRHPNVVQWINNINYQGRIGTVMEFCETGNLEQMLKLQDARFLTEIVAHRYFRNILDAVEYIHRQSIAHRDICLQNILISYQNVAKLADFGHAIRFTEGDPLCEEECGTLGYQATEMLAKRPYNPKIADLYSLGAVLYTMTIGKLPFGAIKNEILIQACKDLRFPETRIMPLSFELRELLRGVLAFHPEMRYSVNRVKHASWMTQTKHRVQIGNFYLVRQPQKTIEGNAERAAKDTFLI